MSRGGCLVFGSCGGASAPPPSPPPHPQSPKSVDKCPGLCGGCDFHGSFGGASAPQPPTAKKMVPRRQLYTPPDEL